MMRIGPPRSDAPQSTDAAQARRDRGETSRDPFRDPRRDSGQNASGSHRDGLGRRDSGSEGARGHAKGGHGAKEGHRDPVSGFEGWGSPFQRLVEERARDGESRHGSGRDRDGDRAEHVLAVTEPRAEAQETSAAQGTPEVKGTQELLATPDRPVGAPSPPAIDAAMLPTGEGERMVALAERVDAALRLDRLSQARSEGTFRLVGDAACGLESVGVALTATSLDVTLTHGFAARPDDLASAAALLAQQLQDRFPTKRVRILQAPTSVDAADRGPDGLAAIGRWLSRPAS